MFPETQYYPSIAMSLYALKIPTYIQYSIQGVGDRVRKLKSLFVDYIYLNRSPAIAYEFSESLSYWGSEIMR